MKFTIDQINDDICVLENIYNGEIVYVKKIDLPSDISEGMVVLFEDNIYKKDIDEQQKRINNLRERMNKLRKEKDEA